MKTGFTGIWIHGKYDEREFFPHSRSDKADAPTSKRLGDLCKLYLPLEPVDITPETESRYQTDLDECLETIGRDKQVDILLPVDIRQLRVDLIATRAVSTVNHYLATFAGFLNWCEVNHYCQDLGKHCTRFTKSIKDPNPFSYEEYCDLIEKGCLHPIDKAAVTVAIYTGLRPGELLALAVEDVAADLSKLNVRRSVTQSLSFKIPKTKKERTVLLLPPAREALKVLIEDASPRSAVDLKVGLNRHESRTDSVRVLLSPETQARKAIGNPLARAVSLEYEMGQPSPACRDPAPSPYQTRHTGGNCPKELPPEN
jgi:integrase